MTAPAHSVADVPVSMYRDLYTGMYLIRQCEEQLNSIFAKNQFPGYIHFFDRSKDVIKRAGENIAATEVERVLNEHPKILESAVISVPDPLRDEAIKAFVVLHPGESMTEDEVRAWCARHLSKFKVPSFCEFRPALPHTSIGKIMKYVLKMEEKNASKQNS